MAILLIDGFDVYNGVTSVSLSPRAKWVFDESYQDPTVVVGRFGGQALQFPSQVTSSGGNYISRFLPSAVAAFAVGCAMRFVTMVTSGTNNGAHLALMSDTTHMVGIRINADGSLSALRMTSNIAVTVLGTTAAGVILAAAWHFVEFVGTISDTTGTIDIVVDGVTVLTLTAQDTRNGTPTTVNKIRIGTTHDDSAAGSVQIDDLYVTDGVSLGQQRIDVIRPSADTVDSDFVPSTGVDNYALVNGILADSTDWVDGSTLGDLDIYELDNMSAVPTTVSAVQLIAFAQKTDAALRSLALVADIGGVQTQSGDLALVASLTRYDAIFETKPGGGGWTGADVDSLRIGPKVTV